MGLDGLLKLFLPLFHIQLSYQTQIKLFYQISLILGLSFKKWALLSSLHYYTMIGVLCLLLGATKYGDI